MVEDFLDDELSTGWDRIRFLLVEEEESHGRVTAAAKANCRFGIIIVGVVVMANPFATVAPRKSCRRKNVSGARLFFLLPATAVSVVVPRLEKEICNTIFRLPRQHQGLDLTRLLFYETNEPTQVNLL